MTKPNEGYNGWTNYETWVTALWIDNDEGTYHAVRDIAGQYIGDDDPRCPHDLADQLKEWAEELFIDPVTEAAGPAGLHVDLLRSAWSEVDWFEIAGNYLSEMQEA
jgi:hypothetical protein